MNGFINVAACHTGAIPVFICRCGQQCSIVVHPDIAFVILKQVAGVIFVATAVMAMAAVKAAV